MIPENAFKYFKIITDVSEALRFAKELLSL